MKGLQFFGNRVEDAANAFIDVLKYSDQSVTYPDFKNMNLECFFGKVIADEEHHIKLLKEAMGMDKATKGVTVIIK